MKRFLLILSLAAVGCGNGSTSPVVEYNAVIQALDRNLKHEDDLNGVINDKTANPETVKKCKENLEKLLKTNDRLRARLAEISARL